MRSSIYLTDGDAKLVCVNDAGEGSTFTEEPGAFAMQIFVLRHQDAAKSQISVGVKS